MRIKNSQGFDASNRPESPEFRKLLPIQPWKGTAQAVAPSINVLAETSKLTACRTSLVRDRSLPAPSSSPYPLRYYDFRRHWTKRIMPHLENEGLKEILVCDFDKYTWGRWRKRFCPGDLPAHFGSCDWWIHHHPPLPRYWEYVKHAACHWLVNFALKLATLAEPKRTWRILTSEHHSTVWDGRQILFDLNFSALGICPTECFKLANARELAPGEPLKVYFAQHHTSEVTAG